MSGPNAYLDGVMIINLERREDRYWFAMGALRMLDFDVWDTEKVIRFIAHDGADYPNVESVQKAAINDGFEEFHGLQGHTEGQTAWYWSWRCALRRIIELNKTLLLVVDGLSAKNGLAILETLQFSLRM